MPVTDALALSPEIGLRYGRAHAIGGAARVSFALFTATRLRGPVLWLAPSWRRERLMGDGLAPALAPGRLLIGRARRMPDLLWAAEEALRSGAVPLVVIDLEARPGLTAIRRLHLAATAGAQQAGGPAPLTLLLTSDAGSVPGVETRWRLDPTPGWAEDGRPRWLLIRERARMAPPARWMVRPTIRGLSLQPLALADEEPPTGR